MKKNNLITMVISIFLICSCNGNRDLDCRKNQENTEEKYWEISLEYTTLSSSRSKTEKNCRIFNDIVKDSILTRKQNFQENVNRLRKELEEKGLAMRYPYILSIKDTIFRADSRYISLRTDIYSITGGANGNTSFTAFNYDVQHGRMLSTDEIFNTSEKQKVNALLKKYLKDPEGCLTFAAPTSDNCSTINFSGESLIFTYEKYVLGPGYCGTPTICIPLKELEGILHIR